MSINEIKVIGVDEFRTHPIEQKNRVLSIYFELSRPPTPDWKKMFKKQNFGKMEIDGRHIVVEALHNEISEKMVEVKNAVAKVNAKL